MQDLTTSNKSKASFSIKDLFNRPGGTFAKITAVGVFGLLGFGFMKALPFLITAAENTIVFIAELVALAAILGVLTSKEFWKWVSLFWLQLNRKIVGMFVKIDPISILEQSIAKMKDKVNNVHENITNLRAILIKMKNKLKEYEAQQQDNIAKLKIQQSRLKIGGMSSNDQLRIEMSVGTLSNDISQLDSIIESQKKRIETSEKYQEVMERLEIIAKAKVERSSLELKRSKDAYEAAEAQKSALKTIQNIMSGDSQSLEEEMAIEHITNTVNLSVAEMERFLNDSNGILENYNLDTAVNEEKVQGILNKYGQGSKGFLSFSDKNAVEVPFEEIKEAEKVPAGRGSSSSSNSGQRWC